MRLLVWSMIAVFFGRAATWADRAPEDPLIALLAMPRYGALLEQGRQALTLGHPEAVAAFRGALHQMEADGLPAASLFPVRIALTTAYLQVGDLRRAEEILQETARSQSGTLGDLSSIELANNWACLHLRQSRFKQARTEFKELLNRLNAIPAGRPLVPSLFENLAVSETRLGLYREALPHQQEAIGRWKAFLPADHVYLIKASATLATIQYLSDDAATARVSMRTAIDSERRSHGDRSPLMADLLGNYAIILRQLGQKREARAAEREASRISPPKTVRTTMTPTVDANALLRGCGHRMQRVSALGESQ